MSNTLLEAGFGSILACVTGKVSLASTINNMVEYNKSNKDIGNLLKVGVSVGQTIASAWEMIGKDLYVIRIGGRTVPVAASVLSGLALNNDFDSMAFTYKKMERLSIVIFIQH